MKGSCLLVIVTVFVSAQREFGLRLSTYFKKLSQLPTELNSRWSDFTSQRKLKETDRPHVIETPPPFYDQGFASVRAELPSMLINIEDFLV